MELWIATSNEGKLREIRSLLMDKDIQVHAQGELSFFSPPPENGDSFEANARIKAKSLKAVKSDCWVLGEDSGLEVEGLGNMPGIHSARYAGPKASTAENNAKLLKMLDLRSYDKRSAQFRCVMVVYSPDGKEHVLDGCLKGEIAKKLQGSTGFGYDPLFIPEGESKTLAELGPGVKNKISHRAQALRKLLEIL
ncbi:MAG: RdgB/HAM1 family non-canonical purine NTP pyrophosphatase [Bdellovibrionaceae bacterium]|nr:RdgB/HAM1 family non-canonical purine NTP pyrophosphatase [Bdellovibrionales bacterium]MCB9084427.1 RdgB/HAM1 family non-canonical purine NTP pyrophosphatase [Pseudobdellovibrionaceae bacterium]